MSKITYVLALAMLMFVLLSAAAPVLADNHPTVSNPSGQSDKAPVQLSAAQKQVMETLYQDLFNKKKEVISKYVEYGVMTEEKGKKIMSRFEEHYVRLKMDGFIPQLKKWNKSERHSH